MNQTDMQEQGKGQQGEQQDMPTTLEYDIEGSPLTITAEGALVVEKLDQLKEAIMSIWPTAKESGQPETETGGPGGGPHGVGIIIGLKKAAQGGGE